MTKRRIQTICAAVLMVVLGGEGWAQSLEEQLAPLVTGAFVDIEARLADNELLIVGIHYQGQQAVFGFGLTPDGAVPDGDTRFEIASLTKPLAALLVHLRVDSGLIGLDSGLESCTDQADTALCFEGAPVTWRQLLTHTSGLPRVPDNLDGDINSYTQESWQTFLASYALGIAPGTQFEYSTVGYGLVSTYLATDASSFASQLHDDVLVPLGMTQTYYSQDEGRVRLCVSLQASGGLESTVHDYLRLIEANLNPEHLPELTNAIVASQEVLSDLTTFPMSISALGWQVLEPTGWYWHGGMGATFRSFATFDGATRVGLVMATNMDIPVGNSEIEQIGFALLAAVPTAIQAPSGQ